MRQTLESVFYLHQLAWHLLVLAVGVAAVLVLIPLDLVAPAFGAPAPLPRRKQPLERHHLVGKWEVWWNGTSCTMLFCQDGSYAHEYGVASVGNGPNYVGTWLYRNGVLKIMERPTWSPPSDTPHVVYVTMHPANDHLGRLISGDIAGAYWYHQPATASPVLFQK